MFSWRSHRREETPSEHTHNPSYRDRSHRGPNDRPVEDEEFHRNQGMDEHSRDRSWERWDRANHFGYAQEPGYGRAHGGSHTAENYDPGYSYRPPSSSKSRGRPPVRRRDNPVPTDVHDAPYFGSDHVGTDTNYGSARGNRGYSSNPSYLNQNEYGHDETYEGRWAARPFGEKELWDERNHRGKGPKGYRRSDERIREEVCEALADHPGVDATEVDVRVDNGTVFLSGMIESRRMKRLLEDVVESCTGVRDVRNDVRLHSNENESLDKAESGRAETSKQKPSARPPALGNEPH